MQLRKESLKFFMISFRSCVGCIFNCDYILCVYFFIRRFKHEIHILWLYPRGGKVKQIHHWLPKGTR